MRGLDLGLGFTNYVGTGGSVERVSVAGLRWCGLCRGGGLSWVRVWEVLVLLCMYVL